MRFLVLIFLSLIVLLAGCSPATPQPAPPTPPPTAVLAPTPSPTLPPPATPAPAPSPTAPPFTLGDPFWIGRGLMIDAVFMPGAAQVAVAWGSGVSLHDTATGTELWYHESPTNLIAFDLQPQGDILAAGLADGSVLLLDVDGTLRLLVEPARPLAYWGDVAFSPDGQTLAYQFTGPGRTDPVSLLDIASGQVREAPNSRIPPNVIPVLAWSPDGQTITVAGLGENCPRLIDVTSGEVRMEAVHAGGCYSPYGMQFLPGGALLVVPGAAGGLDILRFPSGELEASLTGGSSGGWPGVKRDIFTSPDGRWLAVRGGVSMFGYDDGAPLTVWDLSNGRMVAQATGRLELLQDRRRMAAAFVEDEIHILYESGEITRLPFQAPRLTEAVHARIPAAPMAPYSHRWSADGSHLAYDGAFGGAEVWDVAGRSLVRRFEPPLENPSLSADGALAALYNTASGEHQVAATRTGELLAALPGSPVMMGAAFSPDGRSLAYASAASALVTELNSGQTFALTPLFPGSPEPEMTVTRLYWSPDGQALVTVFGNAAAGSTCAGQVILWQRAADGEWQERHRVDNQQACYDLPDLAHAAFNPSGTRAALQAIQVEGDSYANILIYDLTAGEVVRTLENVRIAAWVTDVELLAAELAGNLSLYRFDVVTGERTPASGIDNGSVYSPRGEYFIQMMDPPRRGILIRSTRDNSVVAQGIHEHLNSTGYSWSPDGRWVASFGSEGTIRVWEVLSSLE